MTPLLHGEGKPVRKFILRSLYLSLACVVGLGTAPRAEAAPMFTGLGVSRTDDVSADGSTVVGYFGYPTIPYRWTAAGGIEALPCPDSRGIAHAVSADGSVAVGRCTKSGGVHRAVRWPPSGGWTDLPGSYAYGVSADGLVVAGTYVPLYVGDPDLAWRWTLLNPVTGESTTEYLGSLPGGWDTHAYGISADGSVVVGRGSSSVSSPSCSPICLASA
jgi:uncharacterized membrane protein